MLAYKGVSKDFTGHGGYQFKMGLNTTKEAKCGRNGFHAAENPFDCLTHFGRIHSDIFCLVKAGGDIHEHGCDSRISCTELTFLKKLTAEQFFMLGLGYMMEHPLRECCHVRIDSGNAYGDYTIVRGQNPKATGQLGAYLALAKESKDKTEIIAVNVAQIDGVRYKPDVWYTINELGEVMEMEKTK